MKYQKVAAETTARNANKFPIQPRTWPRRSSMIAPESIRGSFGMVAPPMALVKLLAALRFRGGLCQTGGLDALALRDRPE